MKRRGTPRRRARPTAARFRRISRTPPPTSDSPGSTSWRATARRRCRNSTWRCRWRRARRRCAQPTRCCWSRRAGGTTRSSTCAAPPVATGFLDRAVSVAGQKYRYVVYVPANYASAGRWPVILFLHGAGERGGDGLIQTNVGLAPAIRQAPGRFPAIVVFPQVPTDSQWVGAPADAALAALAQTMKEFHTDPARVYLTGDRKST